MVDLKYLQQKCEKKPSGKTHEQQTTTKEDSRKVEVRKRLITKLFFSLGERINFFIRRARPAKGDLYVGLFQAFKNT